MKYKIKFQGSAVETLRTVLEPATEMVLSVGEEWSSFSQERSWSSTPDGILSPHGDSPLSLQRDTWQQGGVVRLDKCNPHLASLPLPAATCRAMTNAVRELR